MACILKQKTSDSPGIIALTHNEVLTGVADKSIVVKQFLESSYKNKEWLFGVHIQGDCSYLKEWPLKEWQNFIMWPDLKAPFLNNVPRERLVNINCINFNPDFPLCSNQKKEWDICIVSRASTIKRIAETIYTIRKLISLRLNTKVIFIVPDNRDIRKGERTYEEDRIDRRYFDLPEQIFSSKELKNICFLSSSTKSFGMYPITNNVVLDIMAKSKFTMLTSHREGVPRVLVESLLTGTPCIISKNLKCGLLAHFNHKNTLYLEDNIDTDAKKIMGALENYDAFSVSQKDLMIFKEEQNKDRLKKILEQKIISIGKKVAGEWYFNNLNMRLAGHGVKHNFQFIHDPDSFFHWLDASQKDPYNEDSAWREEKIKINPIKFFLNMLIS